MSLFRYKQQVSCITVPSLLCIHVIQFFLRQQSITIHSKQGLIEVTSLTKKLVNSAEELDASMSNSSSSSSSSSNSKNSTGNPEAEWVESVTEVPFTHLSLDIPPCPLFRDSHGGLVIPQVLYVNIFIHI